MDRRKYLTVLGGSVTAALAGCAEQLTSQAELENPSFENGLDGWTVGKNLPSPPGEETGTVDHNVTTSERRAADGDSSLALTISGVADDGTVWVEQTVDLTDVDAVTVEAYSRIRSFNILSELAFFAGEKPDRELQERDFNRDEDIQDHEGWKEYQYDVSDLSGEQTIAVGMNIIWETEVTSLLDNVQLVTEEETTQA